MRVQPTMVGVDVGADELVLSVAGQAPWVLANTPQAITRWLRGLHAPAAIALEATGRYHLALAEAAHRRGHEVLVLNGYRLARYRESLGVRAKTDASDAQVLARFLRAEYAELPAWQPPSRGYQQLQALLHRRATLVQARTRIAQSFRDLPELKRNAQALLRQFRQLDALLCRRITRVLTREHWAPESTRCQAIEGIGPITAAALVMAYQRGHFANSDAFIAFIGLDVSVHQSGRFRARGRLSKRGDGEIRRVLYLAAMQAKRTPQWREYYQRYIDRGFSHIAALNVLARKLARVAFALMRNQTEYQPKNACVET